MKSPEELFEQLRVAKSEVDKARNAAKTTLGVTVSKSITERGCTTDFGAMAFEGWQDVPVILKGTGNGDTLWIVRGTEEEPIFQVAFGYEGDTSKAQRDALAQTPELGPVSCAVPLSKDATRALLGLEDQTSMRESLHHFVALYNKARASLAYKPQVMTEETRMIKSMAKVEADEYGELRLATGIVLEPDIVDSQGDTYSAEEIRKTAHLYMLDYQNVGLQHKAIINSDATVVESFIVPESDSGGIEIGGLLVKSGTWVITVKVFDDDIWALMKRGELTGFSIGGFAKRIPLNEGPESHNPNSLA